MTSLRRVFHRPLVSRRLEEHRYAYVGMLFLLWMFGQHVPGCMTVEQMAPPVDESYSSLAVRRGLAVDTLEAGRSIYLADCSRCHSVEPIARYSKKRWRRILRRMCKESKLDVAQSEAVTAYVLATCDLLATRAEAKGARRMDDFTRKGTGSERRKGIRESARP